MDDAGVSMRWNKKKDRRSFWAYIGEGDSRILIITDNEIDKMNHDIFQQLYDDGFFHYMDTPEGFRSIKQMSENKALISSDDDKYYFIDKYYIIYKMKYISSHIEQREDYNPNKAYVVDDVGKENFIFDKFGMEDYMESPTTGEIVGCFKWGTQDAFRLYRGE